MRRVWIGLVWLSVFAAVVGFYLPWAHFDLREPRLVEQLKAGADQAGVLSPFLEGLGKVTATVRQGTETVTGTLPTLADIPEQISGAQIHELVNQPNAHVAIALVELFTDTRHRIGLKSYAVYLVPGFALLDGLLLTCWRRVRSVTLAVALGCAGLAAAACWKLLTMETTLPLVTITIGSGIWLSLGAYVGLALSALALAIVSTLH